VHPTTDRNLDGACPVGARVPLPRRRRSGAKAAACSIRGVVRRLVGALLGALLAAGPVAAADAVPGELWCGVPDGDGAARDIVRIAFVGNDVTRAAVLERELVQRIGTPCALDDVIDGIQSLTDLGLFRSVRAELALAAASVPANGARAGLVLRYIVREKLFFLAVPRISRTSGGELRTGLQLRWDNFAGRLHELRITSERRREDDGRGRAGDVHSIDYRVPRFLGSDWGADVELAVDDRSVGLARESTSFGEARRESYRVALGIARWLGTSDGVRGWRAQVGGAFEERELALSSGTRGPFLDGRDASVVFGVARHALHHERYRRVGHELKASFRLANAWLGSDFSYHRFDVRYAHYLPLSGGIRNLNVQARLGVSDGAPFGTEAYSIGGGELLRGVAPGRDVGDVLTLVNVELLDAFFTRPQWRRVAFIDIGNVHPKERVRPLAQNVRIGIGLRYKLEALTRTDLRVDVAWDTDRGRAATYLATSVTF